MRIRPPVTTGAALLAIAALLGGAGLLVALALGLVIGVPALVVLRWWRLRACS